MLTWKEEWDLGIKPIDKQHRNILKAINFVCDWACNTKGGKGDMEKVIRALEAYAAKHFAYEENLLRKIGYPPLSDQEREHRLFTKKVQQMKHQLAEATELDDLAFEVVSFLQAWLKHHILEHDADYAPEVRAYFINRTLPLSADAVPVTQENSPAAPLDLAN